MGIVYQPAFAFYVYYFDKRYALAALLNGAASGLALFILPPFIETLKSNYGWSGALKITSALMLHIYVCVDYFCDVQIGKSVEHLKNR